MSIPSEEPDDEHFFATHPERYAHIRKPVRPLTIDKQRAVRYRDECDAEFRAMGVHDWQLRRILLWRMPSDNVHYDPDKPALIKIPMLLLPGEKLEDSDEALRPLIHDLMVGEAKRQGVI